MEELAEFIAKSLAMDPGSVKTDLEETEENVIIYIHAGQNDIGTLIGKKGKIVNSIQTLISMTYPDKRIRVIVDG